MYQGKNSNCPMPRGKCNPRLENGCLQTGRFEIPVFNVLNFRGWIKQIFEQ